MARTTDNYRDLTGIQKAAILMLALGEEVAPKLFAHMSDDEIKELSLAMAALGSVNAAVIERLIVEFSEMLTATGALAGTFDTTERFLSKVLDKRRAGEILDEIRGPVGRTFWEKLANVNEGLLANFLRNEYPQTVAVVLTRISATQAAKTLALFPEPYALEVIMRMLRLESVSKEVLEDVERTLRQEFMSTMGKTTRRDNHEAMSDIFNSFDRRTSAKFLSNLEERNAESAVRIRELMFKFEDLLKLAPGGVQTLMQSVDKSAIALALKGASQELSDTIMTCMSARAGKMLKEEIEALGPVRSRDVAEAQNRILATAKALIDQEKIFILRARASADDDLIY